MKWLRVGKAIAGVFLTVLSAVMLLTTLRAIPNGTIVYVNRCFTGEVVLDIVLLSTGIAIGLIMIVSQFTALWRR